MDDLISRQEAIEAVKKNTFRLTFAEEQNCEGHVAWSAEAVYSDVMEGALLELPSAQPETHEERTETLACDLISRQAAIDAHYEYCNKHPDAGFPVWSLKILEDLPSAQPEHPKGQWTYICNSDVNGLKIVECSKCHKRAYGSGNYCHNCGAEMVKGWE